MEADQPFGSPAGAPTSFGLKAGFRTTSRPLFSNVSKTETNYDEMAELNLGLESGAQVAGPVRHVFPTSWSMFKPGSSSVGQQRRREEQLERYKDQKYQMVIKSRQMMDAFRAAGQALVEVASEPQHVDEMDFGGHGMENSNGNENEESQEKMELDANYRKALMMPEYLSEIPPDFEKDWFCVPFPDGTRCTLIAREGVTQARELDGTLIDEFQSQLPYGSGFMASGSPEHCTILDCIQVEAGTIGRAHSEVTLVYYVLDMMAWNGHFYYNSSAEARVWMKDNWISEIEELRSISKDNRATRNDRLILNLPAYQTTPEGLELACNSPAQSIIAIEPKYHPIHRQRTDPNNDYADDQDDEEEYNSRDRPPVPSCYLHEEHIEFRVEGVMFYFKDMDYVNEQTPVMCLLPLSYARSLYEDFRSAQGGSFSEDQAP